MSRTVNIAAMANELQRNFTRDLYKKLYDACEKANLFWCEGINEETNTFEFWIEDDHWVCVE